MEIRENFHCTWRENGVEEKCELLWIYIPLVHCSGLDMLAAIATQELHGGSEKEGRCGSEDGGERRGSSDGRGRGSVQPKKLAEMEVVTMEQIRSMSGEIFFIYELFLIFNLARNTFRIPT